MKICKLKIQPEFWKLIETGVKKFEIRKLNKSYIKKNDIIHFVDMSDKHLGYAKVKSRECDYKVDIDRYKLDNATLKFVENWYKTELFLTIMEIEVLTEV